MANLTYRISEPKVLPSTDKVKEHLQFNIGLKIAEGQFLGISGFRLMDKKLCPPAVRGARGKYFNQVIFSSSIAEGILDTVRGTTWGASIPQVQESIAFLLYGTKEHDRLFGDATARVTALERENAELRAKLAQKDAATPPWDDSVSYNPTDHPGLV